MDEDVDGVEEDGGGGRCGRGGRGMQERGRERVVGICVGSLRRPKA